MEVMTFALRQAALFLVLCNETTLFFSWVYTPSIPSLTQPWPSNYFVHPLLTTIIYALAEPLACHALLWLPLIPAGSLTMRSGIHCRAAGSSVQTLWRSAAEERLTAMPAREKNELPSDEGAVQIAKPVLSTLDRYLAFLVPVATMAFLNASLVLFVDSLLVPAKTFSAHNANMDLGMNILALSMYGAALAVTRCYSADTNRLHVFRTWKWDRHAATQALYFALLMLLRSVTRVVLGFDFTPLVAVRDEAQAVELFGPQRYEWISRTSENWPAWITPALSASAVFLQILDGWLTWQTSRQNDQKLERLSKARLESGSMRTHDLK